MKLTILMLLAAASAPAATPEGRRVALGEQCFTSTLNGRAIGVTRQVTRAVRLNGRPVWDVVVHQSVPAQRFDMRDHFVLDRADLAPITLDNRRAGVEHVRLTYAKDRVTGTRTEKGVATPIDVATPGKVWNGNLYGVTFGALPLKRGANFRLPFYQYDKGVGRFVVRVTGSETVATPAGPVEAWALDVDDGARCGRSTSSPRRTVANSATAPARSVRAWAATAAGSIDLADHGSEAARLYAKTGDRLGFQR